MRLHSSTLLLIILVFVGSAASSTHFGKSFSHRTSPIQRRGDAGLAKQLLDKEVPDRFKSWSIFKDGNFFRETARKGYVSFLRQYDKNVREPYPFAKGIEKKWTYEPDLRKQYVLPRVLRVPIILQEKPIPHEKEFIAYVKGTDKGLGLSDAAKKHVPDLMEEEEAKNGKSAADSAVKSDSEDLQTEHSGRRVPPGRRRRSRTLRRGDGFNHFRPSQNAPTNAPAASSSEIRPDTIPPRPGAGSNRGGNSVDDDAQQQSPTTPTDSDRSLAAAKLSNALLEMEENFKSLQRLQESQIKKAAVRYVGHPEYIPPAQSGSTATATPGAGLAPIRLGKPASQEVTPNGTPRQFVDPSGAEADASNPITPTRHFYGPAGFSPGLSKQASVELPYIPTPQNEPSPLLSPGIMTPKSQPGTGTPSPGASFRLPANYDDLIHNVRQQSNLAHLRSYVPSNPPMQHTAEYGSAWNHEANLGWDDGRPSEEGIRKMQQIAQREETGDIDVAIYDHDLARALSKHFPVAVDEARSVNGAERTSGTVSPSTKRKDREDAGSSALMLSGRRDTNLQAGGQDEPGRQNNQEPRPQLHDVGMTDASPQDDNHANQSPTPEHVDIGVQDGESSPSREPATKRKRPASLKLALGRLSRVSSFMFPATKTEPTTPYLTHFTQSSKDEDAPSEHSHSPSFGEGFKQMVGSSSARLRQFQDKYRGKPTMTIYQENAAKKHE